VAQTGKQSLPEDGIVLPKYVGAIVRKNKEIYNLSAFSWLISTYVYKLFIRKPDNEYRLGEKHGEDMRVIGNEENPMLACGLDSSASG
jgi:hypothetical protein